MVPTTTKSDFQTRLKTYDVNFDNIEQLYERC